MTSLNWQDLLVAPIVVAAFAWVLWNVVLPVPLRQRLRRLAGRPVTTTAAGCGGGACGGCRDRGARRDARHGAAR